MAILLGSQTAAAIGVELGPPPRLELPEGAFQRGVTLPAPLTAAGVAVDTNDRAAVVSFFNANYRPFESVDIGWTGNHGTCSAGATSEAYADATIGRVNYFRNMAGLPGVTLRGDVSFEVQNAALMMSANGSLSHNPPPTWTCWMAAGVEAAGHSNLALGVSGPAAINLYMDDTGAANTPAGHRRWILFPPQAQMGAGSVPAVAGKAGANALWVIGFFGQRPQGPDGVAWPPRGFVPFQVMPFQSGRWSFSFPDADFNGASVTMSSASGAIAVALEPLAMGYGDNTLVWRPIGIAVGKPATDTTYTVHVSGVKIGATTRDFDYDVTVIDPDAAAPAATIFAAVLPASRSVVVGAAATVFATMVNASGAAVSGCGIGLATSIPAAFSFQPTDSATNVVVGAPNTKIGIAPGGTQGFLLALTPLAPIPPTDVAFSFACADGVAPTAIGLNTLLLSASMTPVPDVVALAATVTRDGIVALPGPSGSGAFAAATVNVGAAGLIRATVDTGGVNLPLALGICQTNPSTGACVSAVAPSVDVSIGPGETPTFTIVLTARGPVLLDPAVNRVFVRFLQEGVTRGATSIAIKTN